MKINVKKSNWLRIGGRHNSDVGEICVFNIALKKVDQFSYHGITILAAVHSDVIFTERGLNFLEA